MGEPRVDHNPNRNAHQCCGAEDHRDPPRCTIAELTGAPISHRADEPGSHMRHDRGASDARRGHQRKSKQADGHQRSEEHTSELQSLMRISYAVFCLKKKKKSKRKITTPKHIQI